MTKEQFEKISGYRRLNHAEIDAMNRVKSLEQELLNELTKIQHIVRDQPLDLVESGRCLIISKQKVQEASMWACRSIALPN